MMKKIRWIFLIFVLGLLGYCGYEYKTVLVQIVSPGWLHQTEWSDIILECMVPDLIQSYNSGTVEALDYVCNRLSVPSDNQTSVVYAAQMISVPQKDFYAPIDNVSSETTEESDSTESVEASRMIPNSGIVYTREQLSDIEFLLGHCYTVDSTTYIEEEEMNAEVLLDMDMTLKQDNSDYQILIYHTHSSTESFADSRPGVLEDTPIGLGDTLTRLLEEYGYKVYHDRTVYDQIDGKIDRNYAYTASGEGIDKILNEHPSIEVIIDLHRDGVNNNTHLVTEINGKPTAKIMFFNGVSRTVKNGELNYLANPNRQANLAFSLQMYLAGKEMDSDFLRNIYIKGYQYNLNRRPKATLIEVGGQTNTVEEANNAMEPLAYILDQVLSGKSKAE